MWSSSGLRGAVLQQSVAYLQGLAEWEASGIAKGLFLAHADQLARSLGIGRAQLDHILGVRSMPGAADLTTLVLALRNAGAGAEAIADLVGIFKSMATQMTTTVGEVVGVASGMGADAAALAEGLGEDFESLKKDIASMGSGVDALKKDFEAIKDGIDSVVDGAEDLGKLGGAVAEGASDLAETAGDLADLWEAITD